MGIWSKIKAWFLGVKLISHDDLIEVMHDVIDTIDYDEDGMISVDEVITIFKHLIR